MVVSDDGVVPQNILKLGKDMTQFTLGASDIGAATGWGAHRIRTILNTPYPLSFAKAPAASRGGNRTRLYRLSNVLERCWTVPSFTQGMALNLIQADQRIRSNHKEPQS